MFKIVTQGWIQYWWWTLNSYSYSSAQVTADLVPTTFTRFAGVQTDTKWSGTFGTGYWGGAQAKE